MAVLASETNSFGGRIVDPAALPADPVAFEADLADSLTAWRSERIRVVWLQIPIERSELVPVAVAAGFVYHHATERTLQLTASIEPESYVPPFATHYIGAGGVVLDEERNLLVIQERHHRRKHYKLPGGALHPGEHIVDAVVREVEEETGIRTEFVSLVCFRHWHGYRHGKSDIYFVTRLRPLMHEIELDPAEIAECFWMPVDDYLAHPDTHAFNRRIVQAALDLEAAGSGLPVGGETADAVGCPVLRPESIPDYGTPQTHELF
ncbi:MAG: NUDIX domain-containing protein, partial [Spirochaetota bacterium]